MKARVLIIGLLTAGAVACDGGDKDDDTAGGDDSGTSGAFAPAEGEWDTGELTVVTDTCGFFEEDPGDTGGEEDSELVTLTVTSETTFTLTQAGDGLNTTCTLDGMSFTCEPETETEDFSGKGIDAVLTTQFAYDGAFTSTTTGTVSFDIDVTCAGKDCALFKKKVPLPCEAEINAPISLVSR